MPKKLNFIFICLLIYVPLSGDDLWNKAMSIYSKHHQAKPLPKKSYRLMESGVPGQQASSNEMWEEFRYEGEKIFRRVLRVKKNGQEVPIPDQAKDKWYPMKPNEKKEKNDYKGIDAIFFADRQKDVSFKKTGKSKNILGRTCFEYSFSLKKMRKGKVEKKRGKTYLEKESGAPCEIRLHNTGNYTKGSPDSFIVFSYDGAVLYPVHIMLNIHMNFLGKQKNLKVEAKMDY